MSSSFAYEDPLLRQNLNTTQKTMEIFKDMGRGMWRSGRGFGKVGALFAGMECVIESVRECFTKMPATAEPFFHNSTEPEMTW
jgi:mitochondrial import inner membrane translocase subunit TIM22